MNFQMSMVKTNTGQNGLDRCYERLAIAIVKNATEDYIVARRALDVNPDNNIAQDKIESAVRFFKTGTFGLLAGIDAKWLCDQLDAQARKGKTRKKPRMIWGREAKT